MDQQSNDPPRRANADELSFDHPTYPMYIDDWIRVDIKIAPLIYKCWKNGLKIIESCQGEYPHRGYISFQSNDDILAFLRLFPTALPFLIFEFIGDGSGDYDFVPLSYDEIVDEEYIDYGSYNILWNPKNFLEIDYIPTSLILMDILLHECGLPKDITKYILTFVREYYDPDSTTIDYVMQQYADANYND